MAERSVTVRLKAEIDAFRAALKGGADAARDLGKAVEGAGKQANAGAMALDKSGKAAQLAGNAAKQAGKDNAEMWRVTADGVKVSTQQRMSLTEVAEANKGMGAAAILAAYQSQTLTAAGEQSVSVWKRASTAIEENRRSMETIGRASMVMGGVLVAGVGLAVKAWSDFSSRLAQVQSLAHANGGQMEQLSDAALHMGTAFGQSANDVADAEIELVKAGVSVKDIMGGALPGALALAAAGQIDVGKATEIASAAMVQFNLAGKDVPHIADLLAAGADKSLGGVEDLGMALKQSGLVANQFGLTVDQTVGTLSEFASAGLIGRDAGTSFKQMLLQLASPSKQAQKKMDELGIAAYDAQGKFVGINALSGELQDKLGSLSDAERNAALSVIFGTDAIRAAAVLTKDGAKGNAEWTKSVNEQGFAAQQAAGKMNSLSGDFTKLKAEATNAMIEMGKQGDGFLRPVVQGVTEAIDAFRKLPEWVKGGMLAFGGVAGAAALAGGAFLTMVPKIAQTVEAFSSLRATLSEASQSVGMVGKLSGAMGTLGKTAGVVGLVGAALDVMFHVVTAKAPTPSVEELTAALFKLGDSTDALGGGNLDDLFSKWDSEFGVAQSSLHGLDESIQRITHPQANDGLNRWADQTFAWTPLAKSETTEVDDKLKKVGETMGALVNQGQADKAAAQFSKLSAEFVKNGSTAQDALDHLPAYKDALEAQASACGVTLTQQEMLDLAVGKIPDKLKRAADATGHTSDIQKLAGQVSEENAKALEKVGLAADGTVTSMQKFADQLFNLGLANMSAREAEGKYQETLRGVDSQTQAIMATMNEHNKVIDQTKNDFDSTSDAGYKAMQVFDGLGNSAIGSMKAMAQNGASQDEMQGKLRTSYNDLVRTAQGFGFTASQADNLARDALGIPDNVNIDTWLHDHASELIAKITGQANALNGKTIDIWATVHSNFEKAADALFGHANGGLIGAPGYATGGQVNVPGYAGGSGFLRGPGTGTSDSMLARVSNGEYVMRQRAVAKYGVGFFDGLNAGTYAPAQALNVGTATARMANIGPTFDYGQLAGMIRSQAPSVSITAPDKATAKDFLDEAMFQTRVHQRAGGTR